MTDDEDKQLSRLLQTLAPPARDPLFRIKVLERRERQHFKRRVVLVVATGVAAAVAYAIAATLGQANGTVRGVGVFVAFALAATLYVPAFLQTMRGMGGK